MAVHREIRFAVSENAGSVSGLLTVSGRALLVLAHGAGAGMGHRFMEEIADRLANRCFHTL